MEQILLVYVFDGANMKMNLFDLAGWWWSITVNWLLKVPLLQVVEKCILRLSQSKPHRDWQKTNFLQWSRFRSF